MHRRYKQIFLGLVIILMTVAGTIISAETQSPQPSIIDTDYEVQDLLEDDSFKRVDTPALPETEIELEVENQEYLDVEPSEVEAYANTRAYGTLGNVPYTYDTYNQTIVFNGQNVSNPQFPMINETLYQTINGNGTPADNYKIRRIEFKGRIATGYVFTNFLSSTEAVIVGLENLDVSKTAYFDNLFYGYVGPTTLTGLTTWNMSSAMSTKDMFAESGKPGMTLNLPWGSATRNITTTFGMFRATKYSTITGLETWNVSSLQDTQAMFINAQNITYLNLSWGSNTRNIKAMNYMFLNTYNLKRIDGTETWNLTGIGSSNEKTPVVDFLAESGVVEFKVPYTFGSNPKVGFFENGFRGAKNIERIVVPEGNNADFFYKSALPNIAMTNGYKGYWAKQGDNQSQWTSSQLMSGYASYQSKSGIYYKVKETSTVNFYVLPNESSSSFEHVQTMSIKTGSVLASYPDMSQYGEGFFGWYRDSALTQPYDVTQTVQFDLNLYGGIANTDPRLPLNPYNVNDIVNIGDTTAASQQGMLQVVSIPAPFTFGNQKVGQGYQQFETQTIEPSVQVFNHPRREAGWNLSVSMSKFSTGTPGQQDYHEVDGRLNFSSTHASSKDTQNTSVDTVNDSFTVYSNNQPTRIAQANQKSGKGHWIFSWFGRDAKSNANVNLELDTHTLKPGTYESNVEWILSSVPE